MPKLAESVESDAQLALFAAEGCNEVLGYLIGDPGRLFASHAMSGFNADFSRTCSFMNELVDFCYGPETVMASLTGDVSLGGKQTRQLHGPRSEFDPTRKPASSLLAARRMGLFTFSKVIGSLISGPVKEAAIRPPAPPRRHRRD